MGLQISTLLALAHSPKQSRVLMVGLDNAGKTTLLYRLKLGEVIFPIPTIEFNVETVSYKNITFTVWDFGGQEPLRPLWRNYYQDTIGIIYVVDSNNPDRLSEAKEELHHLLDADELKDCPVLVLANKQDIPNAVSANKVQEDLQLMEKAKTWYVQAANTITSEGLYEGIDWLANEISK